VDQSLRALLDDLKRTGDLHVVERAVDPRFELGAVLSLRRRGPAQLFRRVLGSELAVVGNVLNSRHRIARGLGVEPVRVQQACLDALDHGLPPRVVNDGAVHEVVIEGRVEIPALLPVPTWFEKEAGPYITAGVILAKDPDTGRRNVSIARLLVLGGDRLMAGIAPTHHLSELARRAQARGRPLDIAVAIGNHPALLIASQMYVDLGHDECDIAGRLLGEPLQLVRGRTVDLEVPAEAEIVLEGTLHPEERVEEPQVSEFHGFYERYGPGQGVRIQALTRRRDAIFQAIAPGAEPEHQLLGATAIGATTCRALRSVMPGVQQVFVTQGGMGRLHAIVTIAAARPGEGKRAAMLALSHTNLLKLVIVVDDDVDPEDWRQIEQALATRMRGERDILVMPGLKADRCEPQQVDLTVTKVGIVATRQSGDREDAGGFEVARAPHGILERVRKELESY